MNFKTETTLYKVLSLPDACLVFRGEKHSRKWTIFSGNSCSSLWSLRERRCVQRCVSFSLSLFLYLYLSLAPRQRHGQRPVASLWLKAPSSPSWSAESQLLGLEEEPHTSFISVFWFLLSLLPLSDEAGSPAAGALKHTCVCVHLIGESPREKKKKKNLQSVKKTFKILFKKLI